MGELVSAHPLLALLCVAVVAFLVGRASSGARAETREQRRLAEEQEVQSALSRVPPATLAEVDRHLGERRKIEAIKVLREATGVGLKVAKLAVERRAEQRPGPRS